MTINVQKLGAESLKNISRFLGHFDRRLIFGADIYLDTVKIEGIKSKAGQYFYRFGCISLVRIIAIDPITNMASAKGSKHDSTESDLADEILIAPNEE